MARRQQKENVPPSESIKGNRHVKKESHLLKSKKPFVKTNNEKNEFNDIIRDINKLVLPHLGKFERKKVEDDRLRALGCKPSHNRKMPLPELRCRQLAAKRSIEKQLEQEAQLGVKMSHGKRTLFEAKKAQRDERHKQKLRKAEPKILGNLGHDYRGILRLNDELKKKYMGGSR